MYGMQKTRDTMYKNEQTAPGAKKTIPTRPTE